METAPQYPLSHSQLYQAQARSSKVIQVNSGPLSPTYIKKGITLTSSTLNSSPAAPQGDGEGADSHQRSVKLFRYSQEAHIAASKIQKVALQRHHLKYKCARRIQSSWRGFLARRKYKSMVLEQHLAANMIQKVWNLSVSLSLPLSSLSLMYLHDLL
jgi:hypothetical protein